MKVYLVRCAQGPGYTAVCKTLEGSIKCLKRLITEHQAKKDPEILNDPYPWATWAWWNLEENVLCFGGEDKTCAEGSITTMELINE